MTAGDIKVTVGEEEDHNEFIIRDLELEHLKVTFSNIFHYLPIFKLELALCSLSIFYSPV